jgi:hypothetical protein
MQLEARPAGLWLGTGLEVWRNGNAIARLKYSSETTFTIYGESYTILPPPDYSTRPYPWKIMKEDTVITEITKTGSFKMNYDGHTYELKSPGINPSDRLLRDLILQDDEQVGTFRRGTGFLSRTIHIDVPDEMPLLAIASLLWLSVSISAF